MTPSRGAVLCGAAAAAIAIAAAATTVAAGGAADVRAVLRLQRGEVNPTMHEVADIALRNATIVVATLVSASIAANGSRLLRLILGAVLGVVLTCNAALVGVAIAAYGPWLAQTVALHLPLEWAAMALAGGGYLAAALDGRQDLWRLSVICAALVLVGAVAEVYSPLAVRR